MGFKQAGYQIVYATDFDKAVIKTYQNNFPGTMAVCEDIKAINFERLLSDLELNAGDIDVLIGGPPCQGFSTAGPRFWDDPRNHLLKQYIRALDTIRPKWFLMENVEGLLTANNGEYIKQTASALIDIGYKIKIEKVYAHEYGIPQRRKRVIIIGNRIGIDFEFPKPISNSHGKIYSKADITLAHALQGLPEPSFENIPLNYYEATTSDWAIQLKGSSITVTEHFIPHLDNIQTARISALKQGQTMKDLPEELQHPSFQKRALRRVMDGTPSEKRGGAPSGLKRLRLDEPSLTITGAAVREFVHPSENRCLTIRECARIQTFPDDFVFHGSNSDKIQQIGNAIPPLLAKTFALHLLQLGFDLLKSNPKGELIDFVLTKSEGFSPALQRTQELLNDLKNNSIRQLAMFE